MPFQLLPNDDDADQNPALDAGRRAFLGGLAAGAAALAIGSPALGQVESEDDGDKGESRDWFALLSDVHIAADAGTYALGQYPSKNLRTVLADVLAQGDGSKGRPPLGLLIDGDLAMREGKEGDYRTLLGLIEPARKAKVPLHMTLGNHDHRGRFRDVLKDDVPSGVTTVENKYVSATEGAGVRLVLLDTLDRTDAVAGSVGPAQLEWLARDLDAHKDRPTLIFHHHDLRVPTVTGLVDSEKLLEVVRPRTQVKALFYGHTHTWSVRKDEPSGIHLVNLPAVAYPFSNDQAIGWCRLTPAPGGASLEFRPLREEPKPSKARVNLRWRDA